MKKITHSKLGLMAAVAILMLPTSPLFACAACYGGKTDSPLASGMNWGIFSLLFMITCVLATIASFFIFLARKSAALAAQSPPPGMLASPQKA